MTLRRIQNVFGLQHSSTPLPEAEICLSPPCIVKSKLQSAQETSCSTVSTRKQSSVCFSTVQERRYNRILGDNPCCEWPLSLGWRWVQGESVPIRQYEMTNHEANPTYSNAKRYEALTVDERRIILRYSGLSESQVRLEERRRRMQLILEVFSSSSLKESADACSVLPSNAEKLLVRYACEQRSNSGK